MINWTLPLVKKYYKVKRDPVMGFEVFNALTDEYLWTECLDEAYTNAEQVYKALLQTKIDNEELA